MKNFEPIINPHMHGYQHTRTDGIIVEVVRCYPDQWNVFLTRAGSVVAMAIDEYRICGHGYLTLTTARKIARTLTNV